MSLLLLLGAVSAQGVAAEETPNIQQLIEQQKAENEALKAKIAKLEQVLKTDVCSNPEALKLMEEDNQAPSPAPVKPE